MPEMGTRTKCIFRIINDSITGDFRGSTNSLKLYAEQCLCVMPGLGTVCGILGFHQISKEACDLFEGGLE